MSSMESLDRLQAELQGNVNPSAYERLYNLTQLASIEHGELMAQAMKWVRKEKLEPLEAENVKLRKLAHGLIDGYECGRGELCEGCTWDGMDDPREFNCKVRAEARKLGVTADD